MIRFLSYLLLLPVLASCSLIVTKPDVSLQRIAPTGVDSSGIDIELNLLIKNPNSFDITLLGYSYTLEVSDLPFASGGIRKTAVFMGKQESGLSIPVRVRHGELLEILKRQHDPDKIPYHLSASLQVDTPIGELSLPIDQRGLFSIPEKYRPGSVLQQIKGLFKLR